MTGTPTTKQALQAEVADLRTRLEEARETLRVIRSGEVDALVVLGPRGEQAYTLKGAEEPYRLMVEAMSEGAVTFAPDGTILYCNARLAEFLKLPLEQVIGVALHSFIAPHERDSFTAQVSRQAVGRWETTLQAKDGTAVPVQFSAHPIKVDHHHEAIVAVVTDLSDIAAAAKAKAQLAHLQELDRLKSLFIASMSHELRTPLNSIIGFTGILLQGIAGELNAEQRKQLAIVHASAKHLLELINDVIDMSKIEAGKVELALGEFDLAALAREVADSFAAAAQAKGLALSVRAAENLIIESDRGRVKQIIANLLGNAVKFTDRGSIEILVTPHGGGAQIEIRDTGIGIRRGDLPKLFTAFAQIVTKGRPQEGSGLGLYLSRRIARLLGGDIAAESEFGKSSVFTLSLPPHPRRTVG